jgi:signal peptidase II
VHHVQGPRGAALTDPTVQAAKTRPAVLLLLIALLVLVVDQASKTAVVRYFADHPPKRILGGIYLEEARNSGAAFSFATGQTIIFTAIAVTVAITIARYSRRIVSLGWASCLGLVLGGALGNLGDRIFREPSVFRGHVVDWIDLRVWPVFNIADSAIVVGGILGVILSMRGIPFDPSKQPKPAQ